MDAEIFLSQEKLVVAKEGFDASNPSLPEGNKLFDSDWLFSGTIVEAGLHIDRASYKWDKRSGGNIGANEATDDSYTQVINFTPLPYIPTVTLIPTADPRYWGDRGMVLLGVDPIELFGRPDDYWRNGEITVSNSQIVIPRTRGRSWHFRESFIYLIMAM